MGVGAWSFLPVVVPSCVLLLTGFVFSIPVESPSVSDLVGDVMPTASFTTASAAEAPAEPPASGPDEAGAFFTGRPQAYAMGLAAAAFLVGVAVLTRGRFYP